MPTWIAVRPPGKPQRHQLGRARATRYLIHIEVEKLIKARRQRQFVRDGRLPLGSVTTSVRTVRDNPITRRLSTLQCSQHDRNRRGIRAVIHMVTLGVKLTLSLSFTQGFLLIFEER
jgi:hypothetical protein